LHPYVSEKLKRGRSKDKECQKEASGIDCHRISPVPLATPLRSRVTAAALWLTDRKTVLSADMVPRRLGPSGISCDVGPRLAEHESTTEHQSPAEQGHCEADRIPTDIARNRPHDASERSCSRWGLWRKSALLAAAVLGVSMPTGVTGDVASVKQAPFMAYAPHIPALK
jgi:hypothetical protein